MTSWLEKLFRWTFKYSYVIAYITAAVIALERRPFLYLAMYILAARR